MRPLIPVLLALLIGGPAAAQDAAKSPKIDGKSLGDPDQQRRADEAMHTEGGKAGRDEPGAHAPSTDAQVFEGGKLKPSAPRNAPSDPARQ
jgi:hypothetical protein